MDTKLVRAQLVELGTRLEEIDKERDVLLKWRDGLQGWLDLQPHQQEAGQLTLLTKSPVSSRRSTSGKPVGTVSFRSMVPQVVMDAGGAPVTTQEILARARERGADTAGADPDRIVEVILYMAKKERGLPVERVSRHIWRSTQ